MRPRFFVYYGVHVYVGWLITSTGEVYEARIDTGELLAFPQLGAKDIIEAVDNNVLLEVRSNPWPTVEVPK